MFTTAPSSPHTAAPSSSFTSRPYTSKHTSWPYSPADFKVQDPSPDEVFYQPTRFVNHIDDHAISTLRQYYAEVLPRKGRILDLCSSWVSHFPPELETATRSGTDLAIIGLGMNAVELERNPILQRRTVQNLNVNPKLPAMDTLDAVTCVVSIDYLTSPLEVLQSARSHMAPGTSVHLVISNRCFPTKAIRRWLQIDEEERLDMVGEYLHFAGFNNIEVVTLSDGRGTSSGFMERMFGVDPLWVVRGTA